MENERKKRYVIACEVGYQFWVNKEMDIKTPI